MNELLTILLDEAAAGGEKQGGGAWGGMIMILAMVVIFYFFMIRPNSKRQKELKKAREAMKKGDRVVTAGGIHGRIKELKDNIVMMEIAQGVVIKIDKTSVFADLSTPSKQEKTSREEDEETADDAGSELEMAAGKVAKK